MADTESIEEKFRDSMFGEVTEKAILEFDRGSYLAQVTKHCEYKPRNEIVAHIDARLRQGLAYTKALLAYSGSQRSITEAQHQQIKEIRRTQELLDKGLRWLTDNHQRLRGANFTVYLGNDRGAPDAKVQTLDIVANQRPLANRQYASGN